MSPQRLAAVFRAQDDFQSVKLNGQILVQQVERGQKGKEMCGVGKTKGLDLALDLFGQIVQFLNITTRKAAKLLPSECITF